MKSLTLVLCALTVVAAKADDCACAYAYTKPETNEYCKCTETIEVRATAYTTCNNIETGNVTSNLVVKNDFVNPPTLATGPDTVVCTHTNNISVAYQVVLVPKPDSTDPGNANQTSYAGDLNPPNARTYASARLFATEPTRATYSRGTPMWCVGFGQDYSGNPSGQFRIEPKGLYEEDISPAILQIAVASGKIDVWHHTDWLTNIVASTADESVIVTNVEAVVDSSFPEQILAKECFVTVSTNAEPSLAVRFYHSDQVEPELT